MILVNTEQCDFAVGYCPCDFEEAQLDLIFVLDASASKFF